MFLNIWCHAFKPQHGVTKIGWKEAVRSPSTGLSRAKLVHCWVPECGGQNPWVLKDRQLEMPGECKQEITIKIRVSRLAMSGNTKEKAGIWTTLIDSHYINLKHLPPPPHSPSHKQGELAISEGPVDTHTKVLACTSHSFRGEKHRKNKPFGLHTRAGCPGKWPHYLLRTKLC